MATSGGLLTGPALWYVNRGTGVMLLILLALSIVLGVLSTGRAAGRWWPRFLTQGLHRNVSLLSVALVAAHAGTAVIDQFVDIRWWQAVVPFGGTYRPVWLGLGTLAFDAMVAVVVSSLLRHRVGPQIWRAMHLSTYPIFGVGLLHGLGIGTDATEPWSLAITVACLAAVGLAAAARLIAARRAAEPPSVPRSVPPVVPHALSSTATRAVPR